MYYSTPSVISQCTANITRNRNRAKIYGDSIYLKDGENFEIELFNPTTVRVLAKIIINGKEISSSGIVLKPGERVYLERFIDSKNKFVFETYEVEKTNESLNAIINNGLVNINFFTEICAGSTFTLQGSTGSTITTTGISYWGGLQGPTRENGPLGVAGIAGVTNVQYTADCTYGGTTINNLFNNTLTETSLKGSNFSNTSNIETGRIEKGNFSKQEFQSTNGIFNNMPSVKISYKLLPVSLKPIETSEIRNYCTECGSRMKKIGWKFCPSCGEKL